MRWIGVGALAIVAFDIVSALLVRPLRFEDVDTTLGLAISTAIPALAAFMDARDARRVRAGVVAGAAVALADATIGWAATWVIGPGAPRTLGGESPVFVVLAVVLTILFVVAIGAVTGLIAGVVAVRMQRRAE